MPLLSTRRARGQVSYHAEFMVRRPRGSHIVTPLLPLEVVSSKNEPIDSTLSTICNKRLSVGRTPHGTSRLLQAIPAWSVKTRHAPPRHYMDARVYDRTTTVMHDMSSPPGPSHAHDTPPHRSHSLRQSKRTFCFLPPSGHRPDVPASGRHPLRRVGQRQP